MNLKGYYDIIKKVLDQVPKLSTKTQTHRLSVVASLINNMVMTS